jgi:hypothetical protein
MLTSGGYKDPRAQIRVGPNGAILAFGSSSARRAHTRNRYHDLSAMIDRFDRIEATDEDYSATRPYVEWAAHERTLIQFDPTTAT